MPQFSTVFLVSQIFWMLISFLGLYCGVRFILFPMYDEIFKKRQQLIDGPLEQAEDLTQKTKELQETLEHKQLLQQKKEEDKIHQVYQSEQQRFMRALQKKEQNLMNSWKKYIQKIEQEEETFLTHEKKWANQITKGQL